MVNNPQDKNEIERMLQFFCDLKKVNFWEVDNENRIDIDGSIRFFPNRFAQDHLPLKFGKVTMTFDIDECHLNTLEGCPYHVGGHFVARINRLKDLKGAPLHVGKDIYLWGNPLASLEGFPNHVYTAIMGYSSSLPLLRLLNATHVLWHMTAPAPEQLDFILEKYKGQGRKGSLACAAELARAGFKANARW
jgi:hypothetical protein